MSRSFFSRIRAAYVQATTVNPIAEAIFEENKTQMASSRGWLKPTL
jgi:hypothetical protein